MGHAARMCEMKNAYKSSVGKPEVMNNLGDRGMKRKIIL
jgi:hypothetical protein